MILNIFNYLYKILNEFSLIFKGNRGDYVRPWQSPVNPLTESSNKAVPYPSDEETNGTISIGFRGPNVINE